VIFIALYSSFLEANLEAGNMRLQKIKQLLHQLPPHNFETFRIIAQHLNAVAGMEQANKVV